MLKPSKPANEEARLRELQEFRILDTAPESAFDDITMLAAGICGTPVSMVSLVDADRQWFKSKVGVSSTETPRDVSFCGHGILQSDLFVVSDAMADERFLDNPLVTGEPNVRFYAGAPLVTRSGASMGMLCVIDRVPRTLEPWQQESLSVLARQVMAQMELRHQNRQLADTISCLEETQTALREANGQLEELATRDGLTGLKNHRSFQESLQLEFSRSARYGGDLSVVMLDVDGFKGYNDSYGHPEGDAVLKRVADIIAAGVRDTDVAARYGGEEFSIVVPSTSRKGAMELGERLRRAVEAGGWNLRQITVSVGVATRRPDTPTAAALLSEADAALYHSKTAGRNRSTHVHDLVFAVEDSDSEWLGEREPQLIVG